MNIDYEGKPFELTKIMSSILKYAWSNMLILSIFWLLGILYYNLQQPVYGTYATVEIKNIENVRRDFFGNAMGDAAGLETEIDIIHSNFLIEKTLKKMHNNVEYLKKVGFFKSENVYKKSPFRVDNFIIYNQEIFGKEILIKDLGGKQFSLAVKTSMKDKLRSFVFGEKTWDIFHKVYVYDKVYVNKDIAFKISRKSPYKGTTYSFKLKSNSTTLHQVQRNLKVAPASTDSSILRLDYKDGNGQRAKDFLNTLIQNYLDYSVGSQTSIDKKRLDFVNSQINAINTKLAQSENSLEGYKTANDISDIQVQIEEIIRKKGEVKEHLQNISVDYHAISLLYKEVMLGHYSVISSLEDKYPVLAALVQNLEELKQKKEGLLVDFTLKHPDVIAVHKNIRHLKDSIISIVKGIKQQVKDKKIAFEHDLAVYIQLLTEFPNKEKELARHERVFKVNDQVYNYLLQKQSELSIEKVSHTANKNILDYAKIAKKLNLQLSLIMILSTLLGLFTVLIHSSFRSKFDVKVKTPEDITHTTDIPLYGIIPFAENKDTYNRAYVLEDATSTASEAFRAVRTNLDYIVAPNGSKVVLVTSNIPNEGKTVVAANLASVIGMSEKRVIILSLDLRRPEMHHKFGLSNKIGMSDVLAGKASLKEAIWEHEIYPNLNIITSGRIPPNPAELLSSNKMKNVIDALKKEYDYIILDTPPINYVADAITLFKLADINLFVVKSDFTEEKHVNELNKLVKKLGLENVGIILNSVKKKHNKIEQFDYKYLYYEPL